MSDFNSALPVRTENNGDAVIRLVDGTVTSQFLTINADGSLNIEQATASLLNATVVATDLDIRDLTAATDSVEAKQATPANLKSEVSQPTASLLNATVVQGTAANLLAQVSQPTAANLNATVVATDLDIRDLAAATDSVSAWLKDATGTAFSSLNPLPVTFTANTAGEVNSYSTSASLAGGGTSNHDYTVSALKTLLLQQIEASGSGKMKIEVQIESSIGSGTFATKFVQFNSTATPNMHIQLTNPISVATGVRVRIIRTNKEGSSQDVYSTISGQES